MTVWFAIAVIVIAATLCVSGCLAYVLISLSRTAPLLGTRLGLAELQIIKVSDAQRPARRFRHPQLRLHPAGLPA
jgi:hypothetical protein